jgi:hypothetical protein
VSSFTLLFVEFFLFTGRVAAFISSFAANCHILEQENYSTYVIVKLNASMAEEQCPPKGPPAEE